MPDNKDGWVEVGSGEVTFGGESVGLGRVFLGPVGTPLPPAPPPTVPVSGVYRPCPHCHYPAMVKINGVQQTPPGGGTLQWEPADEVEPSIPRRRFFIPHSEGCEAAVRRDDDEGNGRIYLPATVFTSVTANLPEPLATASEIIDAALRASE